MKRSALLFSLCAVACIEDLDPRTLVVSPRILDIVAEPPEIGPGGITTLRAVLGGTHGTPVFHWLACISADPTGIPLGTSGFGAVTNEEGCFGATSMTMSLGDSETASLLVPANALDQADAAAERFGGQVSPETLRRILRDVGLVLGVGLVVEVDGRTLRGYKRVVLSRSTRPNHNPPPPRFRMNTTEVTLAPGSVDRCAAVNGSPLRFARNQVVSLVPDPAESMWFERYTVLEATGMLSEREEKAFYSWYITAGSVAMGLTRTPVRDNEWTLPDTVGPQSMWLFVRDGHGGTSGCRVDVDVQ